MEDILIALLQGFAELGGQLLVCLGQALLELIDWGWGTDLFEMFFRMIGSLICSFADSWPGMGNTTRATWISFFYLIIGLVMGAVSVHFHHDVFFRKSANRMMALGLGPVCSGGASWLGAKCRKLTGEIIQPGYYFWWGLSLALGVCIVRFGFCHRPDW